MMLTGSRVRWQWQIRQAVATGCRGMVSDARPSDGGERKFNKNKYRGKSRQQRTDRNTRYDPDRPIRDEATGLTEGGKMNLLWGKQPNSGLVPLDMRDEIYKIHMQDPNGKGELNYLHQKTGLPIPKIQGIIKLRGLELAHEKEKGEPLDQSLDILFREVFGEVRCWKEFDKERERRIRRELRSHKWIVLDEGETEEDLIMKRKEEIRLADFIRGRNAPWKVKDPTHGEEIVKQEGKFQFRKLVGKTKKGGQRKRRRH
mmetsp:Transcript_9315/g.15161  ORF Transcript_9315/g.15161 Transcript_9315/m.15161 type:complete len:258 (-) Transcript_9315:51-824(-)